jgi:catechol 1,2-dioxygenase
LSNKRSQRGLEWFSVIFKQHQLIYVNLKRRKFILSTSLLAISASVAGKVIEIEPGKFAGNCDTTNDILGPFYRPNAPIRDDLTYPGLKGTKIQLKGKLFQSDCKTPVKKAIIEIWHCNTKGEYDNDSKLFLHRARGYSNDDGEYQFQTILPGKYLNGRLYRPSHIHFRITSASTNELVSQVYFKGDPHITKDPWASDKRAEHRILPISPGDIHGNLVVQFDIYLQKK